MNRKEKNRLKRKILRIKKITNVLIIIAILILLSILGLSTYNIINWKIDNKEINNQLKQINENTKIEEIIDNENTETINPPEDEFDPYWDYIKTPLISVDFNSLKNDNPDTVGWIFVGGTNINYPVVQAGNNEYYLNHSFNEKYNDGGWIFMDYRNNNQNFDKNTIIYGHSRYDKSMFGSLRNIINNNWFNDTTNHIIKFSTPKENTLWQVFSVYTIEEEAYYLTTNFKNDKLYNNWLNTMLERSKFNFNTNINTNDKILTLSSCYTSDGIRVVLHAKLIKKEAR